MSGTERRTPDLAVDAIIRDGDRVLLVKPKGSHVKDRWALLGGHVEYGEAVEEAVLREVREEAGLAIEAVEILGVYSDPMRDPRAHKATTVFIADLKGGELRASDDALDARWFKLSEVPNELAYDHSRIFSDYLLWLKKGGTFWSGKTGRSI